MILWSGGALIFQSTLPARGATDYLPKPFTDCIISIHAPRTGSDVIILCFFIRGGIFQSTLPARGATGRVIEADALTIISIHAPRTGSDRELMACMILLEISIHAPRTGSDAYGLQRTQGLS